MLSHAIGTIQNNNVKIFLWNGFLGSTCEVFWFTYVKWLLQWQVLVHLEHCLHTFFHRVRMHLDVVS